MLICVSGGIVVAAKSRLKMVNVSTTSQNILSVLILELNVHYKCAQESAPKEERQDFFDELSTEI